MELEKTMTRETVCGQCVLLSAYGFREDLE